MAPLLSQAVVQLELQEFSMDILEDADRCSAGDGCQTDLWSFTHRVDLHGRFSFWLVAKRGHDLAA